MLATLLSNEYLLNSILLESSVVLLCFQSHLSKQSLKIQYLVGSKIPGIAVPQGCGDALVQSINKQFICVFFHGIHPSVECLPERELLSSYPVLVLHWRN